MERRLQSQRVDCQSGNTLPKPKAPKEDHILVGGCTVLVFIRFISTWYELMYTLKIDWFYGIFEPLLSLLCYDDGIQCLASRSAG